MISSTAVDLTKIRNIGFIAHIDAGKTTVTERVLYFTGETYKIGNIDDGTTVMDFMSLERERGITIGSAATNAKWGDHQINIIDTPGHVDFTAEVERSLRVLDGGVVVLESVSGVQPQSETVWRQADKHHVPRLIFVNKIDRLGANFEHAVETVGDRLGANAVPIQIPMGSELDFIGIIDIVDQKAYVYEDAEAMEHTVVDIPEKYDEKVSECRQSLIEKIAEFDDDLMQKFVEDEFISCEEIKEALRKAVLGLKIFPVLVGSALKHRGIHPLLNAVIDYLPSPVDVPSVTAIDLKNADNTVERHASEDQPLSALAFKVVTDKHVGRLVYLRVYSGLLKPGTMVLNSSNKERERIGRLMVMHADSREEVQSAGPGEIVAVIGLKNTVTGQTLCQLDSPVSLEAITFPDPVLSVAVEPKTRSDQDKMSDALVKLSDEDPTLQVRTDDETAQILLAGMGELHLDVVVERMRREFDVGATVGAPRVAYRETATKTSQAQGKFIKQTGGHGQYGDCTLRIEPLDPGSGIIFESEITGSTLPREYFKSIEAGYREAAQSGFIAGYPVVDVKAVLTDGSHHEVDSSEMAFKVAASMAFKSAMSKANAVILEPVMRIEVITPSQFLGDVIGDLNSRRALVQNTETRSDIQVVDAFIPLAETFQYATRLRSLTTGRAGFSMEIDHYARVPSKLVEKVAK
ncbi:MAG: elongation factor G [Dehalococcoidia bacterium]|nr:elongation factor G [Dehalococcoidia bacterium]MDP7613354.1 elongation factor G [Dehalococcoidia bacterium]